MLARSRTGLPSTARMKSPSLHVDADLRERRAARRLPVLALQDLVDPVGAALGVAGELRPEEAHRDPRGLGAVAAADVGVAAVDLADHLADQVGEVVARLRVGDEGGVLVVHRRPVDAVHGRREEEVAHLAPALVEDLVPLRVAVDGHLEALEGELVLHLDLAGRQVDDGEVLAGGDQHLLAVGGDVVAGEAAELRLLALLQVVDQEGRSGAAAPRRPGRRPPRAGSTPCRPPSGSSCSWRP